MPAYGRSPLANSPLNEVVRHLRRAALRQDANGITDRQLLECFLAHRDETAFEALLRRHGPMVLGVCQRVLRNPHDAEDAFQATFLVLVRKAAFVAPREMVGNWLYGVAYRTALKARTAQARRRKHERRVSALRHGDSSEDALWQDLRPLLDRELERLPDDYRASIILCDLEGKTKREAAGQLGIPEGTLSSRLARGRAILRTRLARRGVTLSLGSLATVLAQQAASARAPAFLVASTVKAALLATQGRDCCPAGATA